MITEPQATSKRMFFNTLCDIVDGHRALMAANPTPQAMQTARRVLQDQFRSLVLSMGYREDEAPDVSANLAPKPDQMQAVVQETAPSAPARRKPGRKPRPVELPHCDRHEWTAETARNRHGGLRRCPKCATEKRIEGIRRAAAARKAAKSHAAAPTLVDQAIQASAKFVEAVAATEKTRPAPAAQLEPTQDLASRYSMPAIFAAVERGKRLYKDVDFAVVMRRRFEGDVVRPAPLNERLAEGEKWLAKYEYVLADKTRQWVCLPPPLAHDKELYDAILAHEPRSSNGSRARAAAALQEASAHAHV